MAWKPDWNSDEPVFRQIARRYEELIISGKLSLGSYLPTERSLAKQIEVNRNRHG